METKEWRAPSHGKRSAWCTFKINACHPSNGKLKELPNYSAIQNASSWHSATLTVLLSFSEGDAIVRSSFCSAGSRLQVLTDGWWNALADARLICLLSATQSKPTGGASSIQISCIVSCWIKTLGGFPWISVSVTLKSSLCLMNQTGVKKGPLFCLLAFFQLTSDSEQIGVWRLILIF